MQQPKLSIKQANLDTALIEHVQSILKPYGTPRLHFDKKAQAEHKKNLVPTIKLETHVLDNENNPVLIYISKEKQGLFITDGGWTLNHIEKYGINLSHEVPKKVFQLIRLIFHIYDDAYQNLYVSNLKPKDDKLTLHKLFLLLQGIIHTQDLVYLKYTRKFIAKQNGKKHPDYYTK